LWQETAQALSKENCPPKTFQKRPFPHAHQPFKDWLVGFRNAIDRGSDPNEFQHILKRLIVPKAEFRNWLRKGKKREKRGPEPGTVGFQSLDRRSFPLMQKLMKNGDVRSAYGAALKLAAEHKIPGSGTPESIAKRVSARFRKEHP
jgi:hypothetical protein